jgi:hypothetical protein
VFLAGRISKGDKASLTAFEQLFGIFSTGSLAVFVATSDYVPSASPLVDTLESTVARLGFGASGVEVEFARFDDLEVALAAVDAQELFFEVKPAFAGVVAAMERRGKQNESVWDGILVRALRRRAAHKTVPYIERPPLDELLAEHKALKDENSDFVRYTSDFSSLSLGAAAVNTLVTADSSRPGVEDDFLRDYEVSVFRLTAERPPRMCKKGLHSVPLSFDYCGECKEFFDDVYFCRFCNTPTSKSLALKFLCRGRFSFSPCDVHGRHAARGRAQR